MLTWNGTGADLARRLHAAAEGGSYEDGLTSDDAEISDLDQAAAQGSHPSEQPADHHGQKGEEEDAEDDEEEEEVDIMNSPLERPWGTDVSSLILRSALPLCMQLYQMHCIIKHIMAVMMSVQGRVMTQFPVTGACLAGCAHASDAIIDSSCSHALWCCSNRETGCHDGVKVLNT